MNWLKRILCFAELKEIEDLKEQIESLKENIEEESELEAHYNNKYPKIDIFYAGRQLPTKKKNVELDVRNFFMLNDAKVKEIANSIPTEETDDLNALACLKWVLSNIKYVSDDTKGSLEFWQFPYETLHYKNGDCEDGAILLANLMIMKGIPYWKVRLSAGNVKGGGHAYLIYYCESEEKWVILDTSYWTNTLQIKDRKNYKDEENYLGVWFSWNLKYSYSKGLNTEAREVLRLK